MPCEGELYVSADGLRHCEKRPDGLPGDSGRISSEHGGWTPPRCSHDEVPRLTEERNWHSGEHLGSDGAKMHDEHLMIVSE